MNDITHAIKEALTNTDFLERTVPALIQWGIKDEDVMMHSLGVSAWNTLGHELGYQAVTECPAPAGIGDNIRNDSTWFNKRSQQPSVFIEFERYDGSEKSKQKLNAKLANLLEAAYRWNQDSPHIILAAWNKDVVSAPDIQALVLQVKRGLKNRKGANIPGLPPRTFLFCRFILETQPNGTLKLQNTFFQEGI